MLNRKQESYGIIGLSRFGMALATELAKAGRDVLCVDTDEDAVKQVRSFTDNAFVADSYSEAALREIGMQNCDTVIVAINGRLDSSILATLTAVELGVKRVISKAESRDHGRVLERIGAEVINPESDMALRLSKRLLTGTITDFISLGDDSEISEIPVGEVFDGKTVLSSSLRHRYGVNLIAIERADNTIIDIRPDTRLQLGDVMVVIGRAEDIHNLEKQE